MVAGLSARLLAVVEALPLRDGMRVLEIGCGPGAMAREMTRRVGSGRVLAIDRSARAIALANAAARPEIESGSLTFRQVAIEDFTPEPGEGPYEIAVAIRVGALDGRHPAAGRRALPRIAAALTLGGLLFVDGGDPLREIHLSA